MQRHISQSCNVISKASCCSWNRACTPSCGRWVKGWSRHREGLDIKSWWTILSACDSVTITSLTPWPFIHKLIMTHAHFSTLLHGLIDVTALINCFVHLHGHFKQKQIWLNQWTVTMTRQIVPFWNKCVIFLLWMVTHAASTCGRCCLCVLRNQDEKRQVANWQCRNVSWGKVLKYLWKEKKKCTDEWSRRIRTEKLGVGRNTEA